MRPRFTAATSPMSTETDVDSTRAGSVNATPAAIDSPAEPVVCTTQFSRMVAREPSTRDSARNRLIEITAIGTEAETVRPTRSAR